RSVRTRPGRSPTPTSARSKRTPVPAPARAAASSPPTRWRSRSSFSASPRSAAAACRRPTRGKRRSRARRASASCSPSAAVGGSALVAKRLIEAGAVDGAARTVTGQTLAAEASRAVETPGQEVVRPLARALKKSGGLVILHGSLAPDGAVMKISGADRMLHRGPARVFDSEEAAFEAVQTQNVKPGDVVVIRYEGPSGGPGMREMLAVTGAIVGAGLADKVALITDGRFSGATHGHVVGHIAPEGRPAGRSRSSATESASSSTRSTT